MKENINNNEIWKPVVGFENYYEVSNLGRVKRKKGLTYYKDGRIAEFSETILKSKLNHKGYPQVYLSVKSKKYTRTVHRLVAEAFIYNNDNKPQVNHIDCDKTNNIVHNLEWVTNRENILHAFENDIFKERDIKNSNRGIKVVNIETGEIFNNIRQASESINYPESHLGAMLRNDKKNKTKLVLYDK